MLFSAKMPKFFILVILLKNYYGLYNILVVDLSIQVGHLIFLNDRLRPFLTNYRLSVIIV